MAWKLNMEYLEGSVPVSLTLNQAKALLDRLQQDTGVVRSAALLQAEGKIRSVYEGVKSRKDFRL